MSHPFFHIVRAQPADASTLTLLAHAAKRHWGYPEHWMALWADDLTFTPQVITRYDTFMAHAGEEILGVYAIDCKHMLCTLEHFWVHPDAMGRGVGRQLFTHALTRAASRGAKRLEIESDPHAEGFYQRMGARRTGARTYVLEGQPRTLPVLTVKL